MKSTENTKLNEYEILKDISDKVSQKKNINTKNMSRAEFIKTISKKE